MSRKITRRSTFAIAAQPAMAPLAVARAQQAGLPDKPLKILVGFPAGGGTDVMARFMAEPLKQRTGRNVLIDNKAGASGTIAVEALKNAGTDGTTIAYVPSATIVQKLTMASAPFDPLVDIQTVALAGTVQTAFCVSPTLGVDTLPEYIEWLKKNPARQNFGTTALGSFTHFFGVMAGREIGIPLEPVPTRAPRRWSPICRVAYSGGLRRHHRLPGASPGGKVKVIFTSGSKPTTSAPEIRPPPSWLSQAPDPGLVRVLRPGQDAGAAGECLEQGAHRRAGNTGHQGQAHRARAGCRDRDARRIHQAHGRRPRAMEDDHRFDRL